MIYFISDTHFNHINVIEYCNRPFKNIQEMNNAIIDKWNETVKDNDIVYHLGDFALGKKEDINDLVSKLKGKIYLVRGNHDNWSASTYEKLGLNILRNPPIRLDEYKLILSHTPIPDKLIPAEYINIHGHIHNKLLYECVEKYDSKLYSMRKHINVSCDVTEFKPINIENLMMCLNENIENK